MPPKTALLKTMLIPSFVGAETREERKYPFATKSTDLVVHKP